MKPRDVGQVPQLRGCLKAKGRERREAQHELANARSLSLSDRNDLLPKLDLVNLEIANLKVPRRNVRKIDLVHVQQVANSIRALGYCVPILVDEQSEVLDGLIRIEAAKLLGLSRIPCVRTNHLSASERRLVRLALNRLGEKGVWDLDELEIELKELILEQAPIEITGFSQPEIDQLVLNENPSGLEAGPLEPASGDDPIARLGDVFLLGEHRIICGDATNRECLSELMADDKARLVLTDEPYNVPIAGHVTSGSHREFVMASGEMNETEFQQFNVAWIEAALPCLCEGGILGTFIDWRGVTSVMTVAAALNLGQLNLIVWVKTNGGLGSLFRSQHELLPLFKKGHAPHINNIELGRHGRWRSNVWTYPGASSFASDARKGLQYHPTVKPVAMLEDALLDVTNRGDIVLDPFLGSGSMLIAAEKTGRRCRGVELDPRYVDVALRRYEGVTRRSPVLVTTGETVAQVASRRSQEANSLQISDVAPRAK